MGYDGVDDHSHLMSSSSETNLSSQTESWGETVY